MEITRIYRVNVGTSTKGVHTYYHTVELSTTEDVDANILRDLILAESDALTLELDKRYPKEE